jgi:hypothetical protein
MLLSPAKAGFDPCKHCTGLYHRCSSAERGILPCLPMLQCALAAPACSEFGWCGLEAQHCSYGCRGGACWTLSESVAHLASSLGPAPAPASAAANGSFNSSKDLHSRRLMQATDRLVYWRMYNKVWRFVPMLAG